MTSPWMQVARRSLVLLAVVYWIVLYCSTHYPVDIPDVVDHFDKVLHFTAYAGLAFLLAGIITLRWGYRRLYFSAVWGVAFCYGMIDEYTQQFAKNRTPDVLDLLADSVGAAAGLLLLYGILRFVRRRVPSCSARLTLSTATSS